MTSPLAPSLRIMLAAACLAAIVPSSVSAQSGASISESLLYQPHTLHNGWRKDVRGLTHFSGMFCPNYIGDLSRSELVPNLKELGTGCVYESEDGKIRAVFRKHKKSDLSHITSNFISGFEQSGFKRAAQNTAPDTIVFHTENRYGEQIMETLISFSGNQSNYSLWIALPSSQLPTELSKVQRNFKKLAQKIEITSRP